MQSDADQRDNTITIQSEKRKREVRKKKEFFKTRQGTPTINRIT